MLIPLGTDRPLQRPTVVTFALVAINVMAFAAQVAVTGSNPDRWDEIRRSLWLDPWSLHWYAPVTSAFLHAGWWHLLGNMLTLWVFGPNVEDRFGRVGFLAFYIVGAYSAAGLHVAFDGHPAIGASGAIASVSGAYLVLFPRTTVRCLFLLMWMGLVRISAWWFITYAVLWDLFSQAAGGQGIAHLAHLGGYAWGIGLSLTLLWLRVLKREPFDLFTILRQASRRREIRSVTAKAERAAAKRWESRSVEDQARLDALASARAHVASLISQGKLGEAAGEYRSLADRFGDLPGAMTLSRQHQYELANYLFRSGEHQSALVAYERFMDSYRLDPSVPSVRLIAALINARYLNDPVRAKALLDGLESRLSESTERSLARELTDELG